MFVLRSIVYTLLVAGALFSAGRSNAARLFRKPLMLKSEKQLDEPQLSHHQQQDEQPTATSPRSTWLSDLWHRLPPTPMKKRHTTTASQALSLEELRELGQEAHVSLKVINANDVAPQELNRATVILQQKKVFCIKCRNVVDADHLSCAPAIKPLHPPSPIQQATERSA